MSYTKTTIVKNPSRNLEERVRRIGVQKYLWLEKLCSDETVPTKVIHVRWTKSTPLHLIKEHEVYAEMIAEGHQEDFGKPEE